MSCLPFTKIIESEKANEGNPLNQEILEPQSDPEIFVALTGRLGTDTRDVSAALSSAFSHYHYKCVPIQVSDLIKEVYPEESYPEEPDERIKKLMKLGTRYREKNKRHDALARLTTISIMKNRKLLTQSISSPSKRTVYIINQLKRPEEVHFFRQVYGKQFFLISCHAAYEARFKRLENQFMLHHAENTDMEHWRHIAKNLIDVDDNESDKKFGQRVQDTFPEADYFINTEINLSLQSKRFVDLIFQDPRISPTKDEFGGYLAASVALRSNDLSRQVGAAILDEHGEVLATGCNEVPVSGGGTYWPDVHEQDTRDVAQGADINTILKKDMVLDIFNRMKNAGWLTEDISSSNASDIIKNHIDKKGGALEKSKILSSLEFGRSMHAEMSAITAAAKSGHKIKDSTLYCTTFPCHNCAKHIVGSGIKRVVFREPYVKSKAVQLYPDAIELDSQNCNLVSFDQFSGVGARRFQDFFAKGTKKLKSGHVKLPKPESAQPMCAPLEPNYTRVEAALANLDEMGR